MHQKFTVKKHNGELIFNDYGGYEFRNPSTMWCIKEANKIYNWADFKEIMINTYDFESSIDEYTYSKNDTYHRTVPDFNFHAWPQVGIHDYIDVVNQMDIIGRENPECMKVGWIGNPDTNKNRVKLVNIGQNRPDIFDFIPMNWIGKNGDILIGNKYISLPDLVKKYGILIDIEGNGFSGRLKHLMWSHRPLLLVDRPHKEFFFEFMQPYIHYIPVKRDLSDLVEKTEWCLQNYNEAQKIAENAYKFAKKYLTREACYAQWNKVIQEVISEGK